MLPAIDFHKRAQFNIHEQFENIGRDLVEKCVVKLCFHGWPIAHIIGKVEVGTNLDEGCGIGA